MGHGVLRETTWPQALQDSDVEDSKGWTVPNTKVCLAFEAISGTGVGWVQPPCDTGRGTLKAARGGHPCTWGPNFASEEDVDRHTRVNTLACLCLSCLFSLFLSCLWGSQEGTSVSGSERCWNTSA